MSSAGEWLHGIKKALGSWDPAKHPRGRDGKFLEVGDIVGIYTGPSSPQVDSGTVIAGHYASDGRFFVAVQSATTGKVSWYRPKQIEQINPKADLQPLTPIPDVGSQGDGTIVPWDAEWATSANTAAASGTKALGEVIEKANAGDPAYKPDELAATMSMENNSAVGAGMQTAAAVAHKQGKVKATDYSPGWWTKDLKAVPESAPAPENVLKEPLKLTGAEWSKMWFLLDEETPEAAGMGFAANGLDLSVTDYASAKAVMLKANGGTFTEPEMLSVLAKLQGAYFKEHPGKPEPGSINVNSFAPKTPGAPTIKLTDNELLVYADFEDHLDGDPFGIANTGQGEFEVYDQAMALEKLKQHKVDQENMDIYDPAVDNLIAKVQAAKAVPVVQAPATTSGVATAPLKLPKGKTPADLIMAITTSAENKFGYYSAEFASVKSAIDAALSHEADPKSAHKYLALAMTKAKLGGKQRARYKQLLDMHHGINPVVPQSPPAGKAAVVGSNHMGSDLPKGGKVLNLTQGNAWVNPGTLNASEAKARIQTAIVNRMKDVPTAEFAKVLKGSPGMSNDAAMVTKLVDRFNAGSVGSGYLLRNSGTWTLQTGTYHPGSGRMELTKANLELAIRQSAVNALIQTWASTSNDNSPRSLALQEFAVEEFNLDPDWIYNWKSTPPTLHQHKSHHAALYRRFLREMHNHTQAEFAKTGVTHVRLRRGVHSPPTQKDWGTQLTGTGKTGGIVQRPMSSYSSNTPTAQGFGSYVHEAYVPVERIIGSALTGFGCQNEYEYVVLGGPNDVKVVYG